MKKRHFFLSSYKYLVSIFTVTRGGRAINSHKWDDMYESVISKRMEKYYPQK